MLTQEELKFIVYWETNREKQSRLDYQILAGIPYGLLFSLPIAVNYIVGRFWYKRADAVGMSQFNPLVLVFAVLLITAFVSVLYKKFRWEQLDQRYKELIVNKDKSA